MTHQWLGVIEEYRDRLDLPDGTPTITLREGGTPMVQSGWLSGLLGAEVWLKVEGNNPTGSFKDRGMTVALSVAVGQGAKAVVCASTGNTSASMAAYAARAGIKPLVLIPQGKIAAGKLAQAIVHGAQVIMVRGNFDECLRISRALAEDFPVALVNSVNPMRLEGQKTASFEIVDFLGRAPDVHVLPTGNAGNISAYWKGYKEYVESGDATHTPVMRGWQASGAAPLVLGHPVPDPETVASAIRIGNPASWDLAMTAAQESGGLFRKVDDDQILAAQRDLASRDGVFVEPASAAGVAGLLLEHAEGADLRGRTVVVTVTGHGLKDIDTALSGFTDLVDTVVDADVESAARAAGLSMSPFVVGPVTVEVPATSANLGPGFDCLGLALDLRDTLTAEVVDSGLVVEVAGEGADSLPRDERHLVVRAVRAGFVALGVEAPGLVLHATNRIPQSRGLGSSSAAIVGGLALARELVEGAQLDDAVLLRLATGIEGHPDNVAPALLGGFVVSGHDGAETWAVRAPVTPGVRTVAFVPPGGLSTEVARGLLPTDVAHADAAANSGRTALLVAAMGGATEQALRATQDFLHQEYRAPAMPESLALVRALRADGHAAVVSGAGPTVLVLTAGDPSALVDRCPPGWACHVLAVDLTGVRRATP